VRETINRIRSLRDRGDRLDLALANILVAGAASRDPLLVLDFLLEPNSESLRRSCLRTLLNVWAAADAQGAIDQILSLKKGKDRTELESRLLGAIAEQNPLLALQILEKNPGIPTSGVNFNAEPLVFQAFLNLGLQNPAEAEARFLEIQDPKMREMALLGLVIARARSGFHEALAWLAESPLDEKSRNEALGTIYQEALRIDGRAAMDELAILMARKSDKQALAVFQQNQQALMALDPGRTLDLLMSQSVEPGYLNTSLRNFFDRLSGSKPADAVKLIGAFLEDPARLAMLDKNSLASLRSSLLFAESASDDTKGFEALSSRTLEWRREEDLKTRLMDVDPGQVATIYLKRDRSDLEWLVCRWSDSDPAAAAKWVAENVSNPEWQAEIQSTIEFSSAIQTPKSYAETLLERRDTPGNRKLATTVAHGLAYTSPPQAAEWAARIQDPEIFKAAVNSISNLWLQEDSVQASEWIAKLPVGPARDQAIRNLIKAVEPTDPESAKEWKKSLETP
jgi:hypothetical protein